MFVKCVACGSERLEPGRFKGLEDPAFIPLNAKFLAAASHVKISFQACADCGLLMASVDPDELNLKATIGGQTATLAQTSSSTQNKLEPAAASEPELEIK